MLEMANTYPGMSRERSEVAASGLSSVMRRSLIIDGKTEELYLRFFVFSNLASQPQN